MKAAVIFLFLICFSIDTYSQRDIEALVNYMVGSFSNGEQSEKDSNLTNIELEVVQIWKDRTDGPWLYIEQSEVNSKDKPYRQSVYQIKQRSDGKVECVVYSIPDPKRFAGDFLKEFPLLRIIPDSLMLRSDCNIVLYRNDNGYFEGGTVDKKCLSELPGVSYTTSEVMIDKDKMIIWDRGFDENGKQVWGLTEGGYIFKKKLNRLQKKF